MLARGSVYLGGRCRMGMGPGQPRAAPWCDCFPTGVSRRPPRRSLCRTHSPPPRPRWCFGDHNNPTPPDPLGTAPGRKRGHRRCSRGPSRAGGRHGHLHVSTGSPGCRKTCLERFPLGATRGRAGSGTGGQRGRSLGSGGVTWAG